MGELIGVKEIATMADVSSAAVANWMNRHSDFPIPVEKMGSGLVFDSDEVAAWLKGRNKHVKPLGFEDTLWKAATSSGGHGRQRVQAHRFGARIPEVRR